MSGSGPTSRALLTREQPLQSPTSPGLKATCPPYLPLPCSWELLPRKPSLRSSLSPQCSLSTHPSPCSLQDWRQTHSPVTFNPSPRPLFRPVVSCPSLLPAHRGARHEPSSTTGAAIQEFRRGQPTTPACHHTTFCGLPASLTSPVASRTDPPPKGPLGPPCLLTTAAKCSSQQVPERLCRLAAFTGLSSQVPPVPPSLSPCAPLLLLLSSVRTPRIPSQRLPKLLSLGHRLAATPPRGRCGSPTAGPGGWGPRRGAPARSIEVSRGGCGLVASLVASHGRCHLCSAAGVVSLSGGMHANSTADRSERSFLDQAACTV